MTKNPYSTSTDIEKVESNWTKTLGLFARKEYSLSIVRAAVTAELSLNYAIRRELHHNHGLPLVFVDKQLKLANGINRKLEQLYVPILEGTKLEDQTKEMAKAIRTLNNERNYIVHRGEFRKKETAQQFVELAEKEINTLVKRYDSFFSLTKFEPSRTFHTNIVMPSGDTIQIPRYPEEDDK